MGAVVHKAPRLRGLRYLGGHPAAPRDLDHIDITFDANGVRFTRRDEQLGTIAWQDIVDLSADAATTRSRVTVPRILVLGIVAAALFQKREHVVLLRVQDRGGAWLFEVDGISLDDLRGGLRAIRADHAT